MKDTIEIRWHGRGGQGAKTAALLLADVAFKTGKYVQGFPEYGPERMGAPITAYNRISSDPIRVHSNIYTPQYVVVVDESLLESVDVTAGLKEDGAIVINTPKTPDEDFHPLFVEALQKQDYVDYLLDVLLSPDMEERAAFIIDCGKEVSNLERRMAELAAGDTAGRRTDHARSTATPER